MLAFQCAMRSDTGHRPNNEDAIFASARLAAVADGVGGAAGGEVASQTVIAALANLEQRGLAGRLEQELCGAILDGNRALACVGLVRPQLSGMATTLTAVALARDGRYLVANIGDSRTYLRRDGELTRLTRDDSLVQALVDDGAISPVEAAHHPQRSVVLSALDGRPRTEVALQSHEARVGDRLVLCSDGLSDVVADVDIGRALTSPSGEECVRRLVDLALAAGASDNISVLVADVVADDR